MRGALLLKEPLLKHTTWRVGGPADRFFIPADVDDLAEFLRGLPPHEPLLWLGLGSNLLVRDGGVRGTVIATAGLSQIEQIGEQRFYAQAGVPSAKIARLSGRASLVGAEFLAGIPGSFGGALAMNAGAFGSETWQLVESVETIDRRGCVRQRGPADFQIGYRRAQGPAGEWFVAAVLRLQPGSNGAERVRQLLEARKRAQPTNQPSCGSVFRNPPPTIENGSPTPRYAARLIEQAGLKGLRDGNAQISEKHANFIVNLGGAQAAEIERLIKTVQNTVLAAHGVTLELEVKIVGEY
jgi:UDP-N-acetylmuramate dehydrogenase